MKTWPFLSLTLRGPVHPEYCQSCGEQEWGDIETWIECDDTDQETQTVIMLCRSCSERIIKPHPRLYVEAPCGAPRPGAMGICSDCRWRKRLACTSPLAKLNGGEGIAVQCAKPQDIHWHGQSEGGGKRIGGTILFYAYPPRSCSGYEQATEPITLTNVSGQTWLDPGHSTEGNEEAAQGVP